MDATVIMSQYIHYILNYATNWLTISLWIQHKRWQKYTKKT